jgi:AraC family transcriptional regulator
MLGAVPVVHALSLPWLRVEYDRVAGMRDGHATTRPGAVGVAFTGQPDAAWLLGGIRTQRAYAPSSVFVVGADPLEWNRWSHTSEAVEFWIDGDWIARVTESAFAWARVEPRTAACDPILVSVASSLRRVLLAGDNDELELEQITVAAARRLAGVRATGSRIVPLDDHLVRRVDEYVREHLAERLYLHELAALVAVSPFHFAKRFKAATGAAPHEYVVARRMDRAMDLLRRTTSTVAAVAEAVGYCDTRNFRRKFHAHWRQSPGRLRDR